MGLMTGKAGMVIGVANQSSIAWAIAQKLAAEGANVGLTYAADNLKRRVEGLSAQIGSQIVVPCDVNDDAAVDAACARMARVHDGIDFIVHAVAYAPSQELAAGLIGTSRTGFLHTMEVSAYSLVALARGARPYFRPGASVLTLTYLGSDRVCSGYNVMGVAKAALEATCRYLAADLGPEGVRVNAISAGPIRTSAAIGLPNFQEMLAKRASQSPIRRNVTHVDVANSAVFLLSDQSAGTTGSVVWVDGGYNIMGTWAEAEPAPAPRDAAPVAMEA